jgi:hypothetical protein
LVKQNPILIKIDVEGFELEVLRGAAKLLMAKRVKLLAIEVSAGPLKALQKTTDELYDILDSFDYDILNRKCQAVDKHYMRSIYFEDLLARPR